MEFWLEDWYDIQDYAKRYVEDLREARKLLDRLILIMEKISRYTPRDKFEASRLVSDAERVYRELIPYLHLEDIESWFMLGEALKYE
jgi:hypothetical protein